MNSSSHSKAPAKTFRFLDLPRELRDNIYSYMVVRGTITSKAVAEKNYYTFGKAYNTNRRVHYDATPCCFPYLNIFRTSHQVYAEAMQIFYEGNTFDYSNGDCTQIIHTLQRWPAGGLASLRRIVLCVIEVIDEDNMNATKAQDYDLEDFDQLCTFLARECNLKFLEVSRDLLSREGRRGSVTGGRGINEKDADMDRVNLENHQTKWTEITLGMRKYIFRIRCDYRAS